MDDMGWSPDLPGDFGSEQWCDAAAEIDCRYQQVLQQDFDSDVTCLQAYLHRVAELGVLPRPLVQHWEKEEIYEGMEAFVELIDSYPLDLEVFQDRDRVYRRSMVHFCSELLQAKAAHLTGQLEKTWWHLSRVSFHEGWAQGYYLAAKPSEDKRRSGKKGGLAKEAAKQQAVRDACIQYLQKDRPSGGWRSTQAAIATVAPKVKQLLEKQREDVDVHTLLHDWLNGDKEIQQAGGLTMRCIKE
jgi:hypothetical protein